MFNELADLINHIIISWMVGRNDDINDLHLQNFKEKIKSYFNTKDGNINNKINRISNYTFIHQANNPKRPTARVYISV